MAKSNLEWAMEAYVHCVEALEPYGSDNKRFRENAIIGASEYERRIKRDNAIKLTLKPNQPKGPAVTMKDVVKYGIKARGQQAGNCFEHAAVAAAFLDAQKSKPVFDVVQIPTLDHAFVIIGQPRPAVGDYPMLFRNWAADAAMCDGWARICCPAQDYGEIWDRTMSIWTAGGLEVPIGDQKWGKASDYRGETEKYPKQSYTVAAAPSKCLLATAACEAMGLDEDCRELNVLRAFRDRVLLDDPAWLGRVRDYYAAAPEAIARIRRSDGQESALRAIHAAYVVPAVAAIDEGRHDAAKAIFLGLLREMRAA